MDVDTAAEAASRSCADAKGSRAGTTGLPVGKEAKDDVGEGAREDVRVSAREGARVEARERTSEDATDGAREREDADMMSRSIEAARG